MSIEISYLICLFVCTFVDIFTHIKSDDKMKNIKKLYRDQERERVSLSNNNNKNEKYMKIYQLNIKSLINNKQNDHHHHHCHRTINKIV